MKFDAELRVSSHLVSKQLLILMLELNVRNGSYIVHDARLLKR